MKKLVGRIITHVKWRKQKLSEYWAVKKIKSQKSFPKLTASNYVKKQKIIVSLTSYKKRFSTLDICIKSLLNQTVLPSKIVLYLSENEKNFELPKNITDLSQYGVEIKYVAEDLKPHKKYYYAMQEYPDDIIITVDDDVIYTPTLIESLFKEHELFPNSIVASRAHRITFNNKRIQNYENWDWRVESKDKPSHLLMATGVGGVLYPPHLLDLGLLLNLQYIHKFLTVDDLWLKMVEVLSDVPVVTCDINVDKKRKEIPTTQQTGLFANNVNKNENNFYLEQLEKEFNLSSHIIELESK